MREFHFHVALHIRKRADLDHAANCVLARFQIRHHQHLAGGYRGGHAQHAALRKHNHRSSFFFEGFGARSDASRNFGDARSMDFHGNFERESVGAQGAARILLRRSSSRHSRRGWHSSAGICDVRQIFSEWRHNQQRQ